MIQVFKPKIRKDKILDDLSVIFNTGWIGLGPKTKEFENKVSEYLNCGNFIATNSCTSSLHLAVKCLDLKPNSKILTTPITFVSTNHAITYDGHVPVFYDVNPNTGNADMESIRKGFEKYPDIAAIMVVHIGGYSCDMDKINEIAKEYGVPVIEDCAHSFGGRYKDKMVGDTDNICVWSFQAVKNLPVGDGGGISTRNHEIASRIRKLIWLGIDKSTVERSHLDSNKQSYNWDYDVVEIGYKYHMNDIVATIGLTQLDYIEEDNNRRREIAKRYMTEIKPGVCEFPSYDDDIISSSHFLPLFFNDRDSVYSRLVDNEIYPGMHYKRNDKYSVFDETMGRSLKCEELSGASEYEKKELTLPIHLNLTNEDIDKIIKLVNNE